MRAIVLDGNENQAVAATRSLARAGYQVTVGSADSWSKAGWSRHAAGSFTYPAPGQDPDGFVQRLIDELGHGSPAVVMPMTEASTIPVSLRRADIEAAGGRMVLPPHEVLLRVFDKSGMTELARSLGIAVPRTWVVEPDTDAAALAAQLPYPVVLKPNVSQQRSAGGGSAPTGAPSYATGARQFTDALAGLRQRCGSVLVQEFVIGTGAGYFALMRLGELRGEFAHRRIRDVRPTGSGSALRESVAPSAAIRDASLALLRAVGWHGVAMVEFKGDPAGRLVLMEINAKFWGSHDMALAAGVRFPSDLAALLEGHTLGAQSPVRRVRYSWPLGGDLWHGMARPATLPRVVWDAISPGVRHNLRWSDPLPHFHEWLQWARSTPNALREARALR